jgi:GTPase
VVADIPGIIEGAHEGKGMGFRFLQHVERTRLLAFLIPLDNEDPQGTYDRLRSEVRQYSSGLADKEHVVVLTKRDLLPADHALPELRAPEALGVRSVSSAAGSGLDELKEDLWKWVGQAKANQAVDSDAAWAEEDG